MGRLNCEALEGRENPVAVGFDPVNNLVSVTVDPGVPSTVSIDKFDASSTSVSVNGAVAALALTNPPGLPTLSFVVNGTPSSKIVAQNNTAQGWFAVGGLGDDTFFSGSAAFNGIVPLAGNDLAYTILAAPGASFTDTVTGASPLDKDVIFVNGNVQVAKKPADELTAFFVNGATPGAGLIRKDLTQLTINPTNNGSVVRLDQVGPASVLASYDLGDGNGPQVRRFDGIVTVAYFGGSGTDVFQDFTGLDLAAYGGAGNDFLQGGPAGLKILKGLGGDDTVVSLSAGHSDMSGNGGKDTVVKLGTGDATFRVGPEDAAVAGFDPAKDLALSP